MSKTLLPGKTLLFHQSPALIIITNRNIYTKKKRAKNKKGIIPLAGMRLIKGLA